MTTGGLFALGLVLLAGSGVAGFRWPRLWLGLVLGSAVALFAAAASVLVGGGAGEWRSALTLGGQPADLSLDGLSALFLALVAIVAGAGAAYSREYWPDEEHPDSAPRGRLWWSAMTLSMALLLAVRNGLHFLIVWEAFAICGYFLIALDRRPSARAAGWLYLAASHAGTLCLFAFFASLAARTGSWDFRALQGVAGLAPLFWLALAGFGVKAGLFPLHLWLPSGHASAPSHVSALMSGLAIKMGVYGIIRFAGLLPASAAAGWALIAIGGAAAVLGIAFALAENDLKRLLAYCSVENIGVIAIGTGGAVLALGRADAPWGRLLLAGALLHVWNHGLFKSLLFLASGSVLHATGTREMSRLGGLWRRMPWTAGLFLVGAVAICGLPPLNGFVSEWLVYLGLFDASIARGPGAWAAMPAAIAIAVAGALSLASFAKAGAVVFLGAPRTQAARSAHEAGGWMRGSMLALAICCAALGLAPVLAWPAIARAVASWNPAWVSASPPAPLLALGRFNLALAALLLCGGWRLWRRSAAATMRRASTWGCAYAAPTPRLQYTSGSFAGIAAGWFGWALRPQLAAVRPRGPFPAKAMRRERIAEPVLERVVGPMALGVSRASRAARRMQHGRLQFYLVYLAGGLAVLALLVIWGSRR